MGAVSVAARYPASLRVSTVSLGFQVVAVTFVAPGLAAEGSRTRVTKLGHAASSCRKVDVRCLPVPIHHVHGEDDRIIPLRGVRPHVVVPRAGHLVNVTHPAEVNAFIKAVISAFAV